MESVKARKLVLSSGSEYYGEGFGADTVRVCEVVFNTSMAGYQEIVSDPSYTDQAVCMTYPIIGNYGITDEDYETKTPTIGALIVRDYNDNPSNFRYTKTLAELMDEYGIPGLAGVDTRRLTREIRSVGSQRGLLCSADMPLEAALEVLNGTELRHDQVRRVSCTKRWYSRTSNHRFTVVAVDCGIKLGMVKALNARGCNVTVVPYNTTAEEIDFMAPDVILLSNGPGDPEDVPEVVETVRRRSRFFPNSSVFSISAVTRIVSPSQRHEVILAGVLWSVPCSSYPSRAPRLSSPQVYTMPPSKRPEKAPELAEMPFLDRNPMLTPR